MMAKNIKKIMAMVLALCMCFSALPLQALAAEGDTGVKEGVPSVEGAPVTNADGTISVTVTYNGTDSNGVKVDGSETTTKDANGNVVKVEGSDTKSWTEDVVLEDGFSVKEGTADVTITDNGDGSYTFEGTASGETVKTPGKDEGNYTLTTDEVVWSGSVEITDENHTVNLVYKKDAEGKIIYDEEGNPVIDEEALYCPVAPEDYEGKEYREGAPYKDKEHPVCSCCGKAICGHDWDGIWKPDLDEFKDVTTEKPEEGFNDGFDMVGTGHGEGTDEASAVFVKYVYEKDEDGNVKKDENGNPILKLGEDGKPVIEYYVSPGGDKSHPAGMMSQGSQFVLKHENGQYFYAYCMDANTGASPTKNRWYHITNIENAIYNAETNPDGYLTEDEAKHIEKIATYGYWGTDHNVYDENGNVVYEKDEDGNVKVDADGNKTIVTDSSVRGSVASLVEMLKNSYPDGTQITVEYPGKAADATYTLTADLFDGLTEAEALAVTQAAIWTYSNMNDIAGRFSVHGVLSALKLHNGSDPRPDSADDFLCKYTPEMDAECDARLQALYEVLVGLGGLSEEDLKNIAGHVELPKAEETTVIPNEGVVTGAALVIQDKVAEAEENKDQNTDNDVYNTDLNFTLAFVPDPKTDDMMVFLYVDGQKDPMQYRLAGGENDVIYNPDGSFTLKNIQLQEGVDHGFDLQIQGTQYLNEGVYIYQAKNEKGELGRNASQTLVGLAAGKQEFVSNTTMTINFTVDEQRKVVAQRTWINNVPVEEQDPPVGPDVPPQEPPQVFNLNREGVVEIIDEQVPLAAAPKTGDASFLFIALALFAAISLCAANFDKKRKHETF